MGYYFCKKWDTTAPIKYSSPCVVSHAKVHRPVSSLNSSAQVERFYLLLVPVWCLKASEWTPLTATSTFNLHMLAQFLHWSLCFRVSVLLGVFHSLVKNLRTSNVTSSPQMMRSKPMHPPARFGVVSSIKHSAVFVLSCCITKVLCHICHYRSQVVASVLTVCELLPDMIQGCPRMAMQNWNSSNNSSNSNNSNTRKERRKTI